MRNSTAFRRVAVQSLGLPYPRYLWLVVRQSALVWVLARLLIFVLLWMAGGIVTALHPTLTTRAFLVAITAFLVWWDRRRAHELLLPANLGAWPGWYWVASLFTASTLDLILQTLVAVR